MIFKKIMWSLKINMKRVIHAFFKFYEPRSRFIHVNVPYFDQSNNGGKNKQEIDLWAENGCGMACLKMILGYKRDKRHSVAELGIMCQRYGGYTPNKNTLDGLFYGPFLKFIKQEFGMQGKVISPMILEDILKALSEGNFVIASVSSDIRFRSYNPGLSSQFQTGVGKTNRGGHLILITGYDLKEKILYFHNPSDPNNRKYRNISFSKFDKFFANRGLVIYPT